MMLCKKKKQQALSLACNKNLFTNFVNLYKGLTQHRRTDPDQLYRDFNVGVDGKENCETRLSFRSNSADFSRSNNAVELN